MARLLKDLLDVSRISHQKIDLNIESVELESIMKAAIETTRPGFSRGKHEVSVSFPKEPVIIEGDQLRIEQIIVNILNNASKYTPDGGRISLSGRKEGENAVITVKDNGIGIPSETMPKIFTLFSQDEKSIGMAKGGLGIGLALAKALAELHGGAIPASSEGAGKGAAFEVTLPLKHTS
jgi:signal transduction histidine kinase